MIYQFEYDEIHHCYECPLFYDYIYCELDCNNEYTSYTDSDDNKRPDWCPLKESPELKSSKSEETSNQTIVSIAAYSKRNIPRSIELTYEFLAVLTHILRKEEYLEYIEILKAILKTEVSK